MLAGDSAQVRVEGAMQLALDACQHSELLQVPPASTAIATLYIKIGLGAIASSCPLHTLNTITCLHRCHSLQTCVMDIRQLPGISEEGENPSSAHSRVVAGPQAEQSQLRAELHASQVSCAGAQQQLAALRRHLQDSQVCHPHLIQKSYHRVLAQIPP